MDDTCVPIVFTEYKIAVPNAKVDLPRFMNDFGVPDFNTPTHVSDLGHAGCLFIEGKTGLARYYEYGRYDSAAKGLTRKQSIPDIKLSKGAEPIWATVKTTLHSISAKAGHGGPISGAWIAAPGQFKAMQTYADKRMAENAVASRREYELMFNSCLHFMKGVMEAAGITTPPAFDPRPVGYIAMIRAMHTTLDYNPRAKTLTIGGATKT